MEALGHHPLTHFIAALAGLLLAVVVILWPLIAVFYKIATNREYNRTQMTIGGVKVQISKSPRKVTP